VSCGFQVTVVSPLTLVALTVPAGAGLRVTSGAKVNVAGPAAVVRPSMT
jgi:hypothetical protein